ncbi:MAG: glycosyltransferase family 39 protein [Hyphomicrobiales bacterium]|nr:glycosyltransferase family 39 protein [Hyphomicrobiales bacterium]
MKKRSSAEWTDDADGVAAPYALWTAAALCALLIWRIGALYASNTELFFDEAQYWAWSQEPALGYYSKPPLIAWLIGGTTALCGSDGEFCVRLSSPILHAATAFLVFLIARRLFSERAAFWSALGYATLPGVSFSAGLISTDVPLLFFWAAALLVFIVLLETRSWAAAVVLGLALGFGLLSKYAMVYFLGCALVYALWTDKGRAMLRDPRLYAALAIAGLVVAPNMVWNAQNQFATFAHTADNAKWSGSLVNPGSALEFFAAQTGVFGAILFAAFLWALWRLRREPLTDTQKLLISFSVPVILVITAQAFLSRAHANWAAVAYVAAVIFVSVELLRRGYERLLAGSLALHVAALILIGIGNAGAGRFSLPGGFDPYERVLGWRALAEEADAQVAAGGFKAVAVDKRSLTAELIYYMKSGAPIVALRDGAPRDHFELSRPVTAGTPEPILFVSFKPKAARLSQFFETVELVATKDTLAGAAGARRVYFFKLTGYKERAAVR